MAGLTGRTDLLNDGGWNDRSPILFIVTAELEKQLHCLCSVLWSGRDVLYIMDISELLAFTDSNENKNREWVEMAVQMYCGVEMF